MKYIKKKEIIDTPYIIDVDNTPLELSDGQLRQMGYTPLDEVIIEQGDKLENLVPSVDEIKAKVMEQLEVTIPQGGLPFKLGYTWAPKIIGKSITFELTRDSEAIGTDHNPIIFCEFVKLIPNAFYLYEGESYVYVGAPGKATTWDECKDDMEIM